MQRFNPSRFHDNFRPASDQCVAQFREHDFHIGGVVLDSPQYLAAARAVHDCGNHFIDIVPYRLCRLSCARRRKIVWIYGLGRVDLFPDVDLARPTGVCHAAARDHHSRPCFPTPLGSTSASGPVGNANMALRFGHGCARLLYALQMVPPGESCTSAVVDV